MINKRMTLLTVLCTMSWLGFCPITLANEPTRNQQRIISLGGDITEIIYALQAQQQLVGVDTTSQWPAATQSLPKVGYFRALSAKGLLSLVPDLLIMSGAADPASVIEQIQSVGIATVRTNSAKTPEGVLKKVHRVAQVLSLPEQGEQLITAIQADYNKLEFQRKHWKNRPRVVFLFSVSKGAAKASRQATATDAMIKLAGGINVFSEYTGYKPINSEALIAAAPEFILLTDNTLKSMGGLDKIMSLPGISLTSAAINTRVIAVNTLYLLDFGSRNRTGSNRVESIFSFQINRYSNQNVEKIPEYENFPSLIKS